MMVFPRILHLIMIKCAAKESVFTGLKKLSQYKFFVRLCLYLHPAAPLFQSDHVVVYWYDCRYLPYSIHFSEFMPIFFHEKTDKTGKYSKSVIFESYKNGRRRKYRRVKLKFSAQ